MGWRSHDFVSCQRHAYLPEHQISYTASQASIATKTWKFFLLHMLLTTWVIMPGFCPRPRWVRESSLGLPFCQESLLHPEGQPGRPARDPRTSMDKNSPAKHDFIFLFILSVVGCNKISLLHESVSASCNLHCDWLYSGNIMLDTPVVSLFSGCD